MALQGGDGSLPAFQYEGNGLVKQFIAVGVRIDNIGGFDGRFTAEQALPHNWSALVL